MHALPQGWTIERHDWVESTNTTAEALARAGAPEGTVVVAQGQKAGRGRWGRSWESPFGKNLYISTILRPHSPPEEVSVLTLVAGLAVAEMLDEDYGLIARLKWPNDIWLSGKKVGGILTELHTENGRVDYVILGLGLNVNATAADFSPELAGQATSLGMASGKNFSIGDMIQNCCFHLEHCYQEFTIDDFGGMQKEYEAVMALKGERVRIDGLGPEVSGIVTGVDTRGRLQLADASGNVTAIEAGEVVKLCSS